ncbi:MAG TPA: VWA domain-containing protein [Atribacteraceae bacterium]|nr:VWA domain-containing protein [Atribacteraceae bacterium]
MDDTVEMNVSLSQGLRRLPVFLLLDISGSMMGAPVQAVQEGVALFKREVESDTFARETVWIGVITFGRQVSNLTGGLVPIEQFSPPILDAGGYTPLGQAMRLLIELLDRDVKKSQIGGEKGDWKPLVFILTDGKPTDNWQGAREEILKRKDRKIVQVITVGCGPEIDETTLREVAIGPSFRMDADSVSFAAFFRWISQTVKTVSKSLSQPQGESLPTPIPPPPEALQYIP